jgi:hypothetical protein
MWTDRNNRYSGLVVSFLSSTDQEAVVNSAGNLDRLKQFPFVRFLEIVLIAISNIELMLHSKNP